MFFFFSVSSECTVLCKSHLISFSSGLLENMVQFGFFFPPSSFLEKLMCTDATLCLTYLNCSMMSELGSPL